MPRIITVGIPVRNEEDMIADTIARLQNQRLPEDTEIEILVGANGCTDDTESIIRRIVGNDGRVKLLSTPERGKWRAMNLIRDAARGDAIVFCDADTQLEREGVKKLLRVLDNNPGVSAVSVVARPLERWPRSWTEAMTAAVKKVNVTKTLARLDRNDFRGRPITGCVMAFRKDELPEIPANAGGEDIWLSRHFGLERCAMAPAVWAHTQSPLTVKDFLRQMIRVRAVNIQARGGLLREARRRRKPALPSLTGLSAAERILWIPGVAIGRYSSWAGKRAFTRGEFRKGDWASPKRR